MNSLVPPVERNSTPSALSKDNPARKIFESENKNGEICILSNGIYYNPADEEVIEILDDFEDKTIRIEPIKSVSIGIKEDIAKATKKADEEKISTDK